MRTPQRNESGVDLLIEYFNQLHFIEKRFFPSDRVLGAHFHWYVKQHVEYWYLSVYKTIVTETVIASAVGFNPGPLTYTSSTLSS